MVQQGLLNRAGHRRVSVELCFYQVAISAKQQNYSVI